MKTPRVYTDGVRYFLKGNLPRATSQVTIFQVASSKAQVRLSEVPQAAMGGALLLEQARGRALRLGKLGKLQVGKLQIWEVAAWENNLGKLPLGKVPSQITKEEVDDFYESSYNFKLSNEHETQKLCSVHRHILLNK